MQSVPFLTLGEAILRSAAASPDKVAIRLDEDRRTYRTIADNAQRRARQLAGLGLKRGDRFGIMLPNSFDAIEFILAASIGGFVAVPINIRFKGFEVHHLISHSGMRVLVTIGGIADVVDFGAVVATALPGLATAPDPYHLAPAEAPMLRSIVRLTGVDHGPSSIFLNCDDLPEARLDTSETNTPGSALLLLYTSGTTARPKGCIISERALRANITGITERLGLASGDRWWCPLPMFHVGGILFPMMMLSIGGCYLTTVHFDAERSVDLIAQERPSIIYSLFPTITLQLMDSPRFPSLPLDQVRLVVNVAPHDLQKRIQNAFRPAKLLSAFGMTEAGGVVTYNLPSDTEAQRTTSCGLPLSGWDVAIANSETHALLDQGSEGEIAIRGDGLFDGYLGDPEATAQQFTADGYFLTGDAGLIGSDGALHFLGRLKDQLKVGGENVSALEVESFLCSHPAIKMTQVVGVTDDRYGEVPAAFIELHEGKVLREEDVLSFCAGQIARFKTPRFVRFVSEWPMSATKIQKFRLKAAIEQELQAQSAS
jgi:acyl-CoA synthetase (AMP-forming)/AMP-acid ligase II